MRITAVALVLDFSDCALLPPVDRTRGVGVLVHELSLPTTPKHSVVIDLRPGEGAPEFLLRHVPKLVQLQFVRLVYLVDLVDVLNVLLEHIEPPSLVLEVPGHRSYKSQRFSSDARSLSVIGVLLPATAKPRATARAKKMTFDIMTMVRIASWN